MSWWDSDANKQDTRTLWSWGNASALFHTGRAADKPHIWPPEPMSDRARHQRGRSLAETFEGISQHNDQEGLGTGPFGRFTLRSWWR